MESESHPQNVERNVVVVVADAAISSASAGFSTPPSTPPSASRRNYTVIPETPCKRRRLTGETTVPYYIKEALDIGKKITSLSTFKTPFKLFNVVVKSFIKFMGQGSFNEAYLVEGTGLRGAQEKSTFVIKIPLSKWLDPTSKVLKKTIETDAKYYRIIKEAFKENESLKIATHYNLETPSQNLQPYAIVDYVENPMPKTLDDDQKVRLKTIIAFCWKHKELPIDLQKSNMGINQAGEWVLFDPVDSQGTSFEKTVDRCLKSFAKDDPSLFNYLDPRPRSLASPS